MQINHILETCLYVDDLESAASFYTDVLGLTEISRQLPRHVFLRCGTQMLLLFNPQESQRGDGELPPHGATGSAHVAFAITASDAADWKKRLERFGVAIERQVSWSRGDSFYFRDPDGNSVELASPTIWSSD